MNKIPFATLVALGALGVLPGSHNHGVYAGEAKHGLRIPPMREWGNLPLAGSGKGDRAEIERIYVGTFALNQGQPNIFSRELPIGDPWVALRLNLRGQLVCVASPTGTVVADAPTTLWQIALTTDIDRDVVEPSVSARALYRYAQFMSGTAGELVAPVQTASTTTDFNAVITIPFSDNMVRNPNDTILDTRRYQSVTLTITQGVLADIVTSATNTTLANTFVDIEVVRVSPRVPMPLNVAKALPFFKRHAPIVPATDTFVNLDRIPTLAIKRLAWLCTTGSTAGTPFTGTGSNGCIDTIRVSSNLRDHFGSAMGGVTRRTLQGGNKDDYGIETWPTGWFVADFCRDFSNNSALATGDKSMLQALFTYFATPATPQVSTLVAGIQKLRGTEGR